ncbi:putative odorant receptor 83c [Toxorhynchites rutilus septentrionalis]|uniref:putative odorant receptor 83c n=1 Tax=Toxorhynchites rutilus septentrionalis TaxID=329112 RepID=UPI0024788D8B|nr:putative odorant receptor 83c [Toxorhynchites rutilus septentrionalis]
MEDTKFLAVFRIVRHSLRLTGIDIFAENWRPNAWFIMCLTMLVIQPYVALYFIVKYTDSINLFAECISIMISTLDALFGLVEFVVNRGAWNSVMQDVHDRRFMYKTQRMSELFDRYYERNLFFVRVLYAIYMSTFSYCLLPLVISEPSKFNLPLPFILPHVDPSQQFFYPLNYIHHLLISLVSQHVLIGQCSALVIGVVSACCQIEALKLQLEDLNEQINDPAVKAATLRESIVEIIKLHAATKEYISRIQKKYALVYLSMFVTCGVIVCMCLNVIADDFYNSAPFLMMAGGFSMLVHCFFGNKLLIANDSLPAAIYGIDWYRLPIPEQKMIGFLLTNAQRDALLNGVFMPLNMSSYLSIMKAAFSYYSILN